MKKISLVFILFISLKAAALKGIASHYAKRFNGKKTATGEIYKKDSLTAASNHFKLNSFVKVINLLNGNEVIVKINDRMGKRGRIIDLSEKAASILGFKNTLIKVNVNYL